MNQQNVNFFPWDDISEESVFPTGCFQMALEDLEDGTSNTGKRMLRARYACKAPVEFVGMSHFEYYVVGTDENPGGVNPGTMGARGLKKMLKAAQVPPSNDIQRICHSAKGAELMLSLNQFTEKDGAYAGTKRNRIADYHRLGEREAKVAAGAGGAPGMGAPVMAPPAMPAAPAMAAPQAAPVQAPTMAAPQPAPATTAAPAAWGAPPVGAPAPQPAPQPAYGAPPMQAAPAAGPAETMLRCTICQQDVAVSQFGAHVQAHATARA